MLRKLANLVVQVRFAVGPQDVFQKNCLFSHRFDGCPRWFSLRAAWFNGPFQGFEVNHMF